MKPGLIIFLIFGAIGLKAQTYTALEGANAVWYVQMAALLDSTTGYPAYFDHYFFQFQGDTVINNKSSRKYYYQLYRNHSSLGIFYFGAIREDGKKVYFTHRDSLGERLLYDFEKMNIGDTLPAGVWSYSDEDTLCVVKDTGNIQLQDGSVRRYYIYGIPNNQFDQRKLMEGIGSNYGLVPIRYVSSVKQYVSGALAQVCKDHVALLEYVPQSQLPPNGNACNYFVGTENYNRTIAGINISPNPFDDKIYIKSKNLDLKESIVFNVYNTDGKLIFYRKIESLADCSITLANLPAGIYFCVLFNSKIHFIEKIIKN